MKLEKKLVWRCAWCADGDESQWIFERRGALWLPVEQTHGICCECLDRCFPPNSQPASR